MFAHIPHLEGVISSGIQYPAILAKLKCSDGIRTHFGTADKVVVAGLASEVLCRFITASTREHNVLRVELDHVNWPGVLCIGKDNLFRIA